MFVATRLRVTSSRSVVPATSSEKRVSRSWPRRRTHSWRCGSSAAHPSSSCATCGTSIWASWQVGVGGASWRRLRYIGLENTPACWGGRVRWCSRFYLHLHGRVPSFPCLHLGLHLATKRCASPHAGVRRLATSAMVASATKTAHAPRTVQHAAIAIAAQCNQTPNTCATTGDLKLFKVHTSTPELQRVEYVSVLPWPFEPRWALADMRFGYELGRGGAGRDGAGVKLFGRGGT